MRDNHEEMPEIVDAFEQGGQHFGIVGIEVGGINKKFQFGITPAGYRALRKLLQLRPFDAMPGVRQRYFFAKSYFKIPEGSDCGMYVRIEQGRDGKSMDVVVPKDLLANLIWFGEIKDFSEAGHLPEIK